MTARCEKTDLPVDMCGDSCCRPDLAETAPEFVPLQYEGSWREARFPGTCGCGCGRRIHEGDDIVLADLDGNGVNDAWCLIEHTRAAGAVH